ncbi:FtsW/RodA/SpoVE family cell cycle protein [Nocardioides cavernae]|uniref:beta-lactamase n=1 Tax=Nocardioides cavernae TaxID=1921566 RepID=A0ABR8NG95_9ACTN|nr:FtsW/RodA/SpoVE family cell cycle protein [Nocardioides cavernae]MBD3925474.1 FtsW/RodA/SpoVE family cell cycle protein [Nocardioides cavernae]MBM7514147.1 cell division protein FtsI/penicillin-binding protein 2/cell division protein FtsW (lipid II flippase) [Nocardioides cavernae]
MLSVERGLLGGRRSRPGPGRPVQLPDAALVDPLAVGAVAVLVGLGLANLVALGDLSAVRHQLVVVVGGVVLFLVLRRWRTEGLRWLGWGCYLLSVLLLVAVDVGGLTVRGAQRWIAIGPLSMQPSELAKLGLLLVLAQVLGSDRSWPRRLATAVPVAALPVALILLQPDLSTALVLCAVVFTMLMLGRIPLTVLVSVLVATVLTLPFVVHLLHPYQQDRLNAFLSGSTGVDGPGWAIQQMHIALAWGGLTGGADHPLHDLVGLYLPDRHTDLAFASVVEQFGIVAGALAVLAAAVLVWRAVAASRRARTRPAALAAAGFAALVSVEVAISVACNLGLAPTAGVPFPLVSQGGTAAAVHIAALGLVLALGADGETHRLWNGRPDAARPRLLRTTAVTVTALLVGMVGFVWQLQSAQGSQLREAALDQMLRCTRVPAARGEITDRHGTPLALDVRRHRVAVVPALVRPTDVSSLAALTARPESGLRRLLRRDRASRDVTVASLPPAAGRRVREAALPGVFVVPDTRRRYPAGDVLGPVLGWTGVATPVEMERWPDLALGAIAGRAGLEQVYDPILRGTDGRQCVYVTPAGTPMAMGPYTPPRRGNTLRLTLDLGLQRELTRSLDAVLRSRPGQPLGDLGGAVLLDPRNGQVLATASRPSYDNRVFGPPVDNRALASVSRRAGSPMLDHVTQVAAPPGSTFKLVVAAASMRDGTVPPDRVLPGGGSWTLGDHSFGNWMSLPAQDLPNAISWSNNVYFYQLAWAMGPGPMISTARSLGVGRPTGVDLPGESAGYLGTPDSISRDGGTWYPGSTVILGIGQGYITVTPLQDALWTAGIATGAVVTPHLGLAYGEGPGRSALRWPRPRRLPYADRLGPVREGMALAATSGTASILTALPVRAGAKTGSAQDPSAPNGAPDSWFTAAAPLDRPRVVATSFVRGGGHGVSTSGAVVLPVLEYFFAHEEEILRTGPPARRRR